MLILRQVITEPCRSMIRNQSMKTIAVARTLTAPMSARSKRARSPCRLGGSGRMEVDAPGRAMPVAQLLVEQIG
ncbi:MAG TPA: hypothetical protein VF549_02080 [Solirubrobacteraceae bacterium]